MEYAKCGLMREGWFLDFPISRLAPTRVLNVTPDNFDTIIDRGSWLLSVIPLDLYTNFTKAYHGTYEDLVDDINRALGSLSQDAVQATLGWYDKAVQDRGKEVCWQPLYQLAQRQYKSAIGALNSLFLNPKKESHKKFLQRPVQLPPEYLNHNVSHCIDPSSARYKMISQLVKLAPQKLVDFRKKFDLAADPFARALFHGARSVYICPYSSGCSSSLTPDAAYLPSTFDDYYTVLIRLFESKKAICLAFDGVDVPLGAFTIAIASGQRRGQFPNSLSCADKQCYGDYQLLQSKNKTLCLLSEHGDSYVMAKLFDKKRQCGTKILAVSECEYSPVCKCLASRKQDCRNYKCFTELFVANDKNLDKLRDECNNGILSHDDGFHVEYPYSYFKGISPTCGRKMIKYSAEERREICECHREDALAYVDESLAVGHSISGDTQNINQDRVEGKPSASKVSGRTPISGPPSRQAN